VARLATHACRRRSRPPGSGTGRLFRRAPEHQPASNTHAPCGRSSTGRATVSKAARCGFNSCRPCASPACPENRSLRTPQWTAKTRPGSPRPGRIWGEGDGQPAYLGSRRYRVRLAGPRRWACGATGSAPVWRTEGSGFESPQVHAVDEDRRSSWNAHLTLTQEIAGSSPARSTVFRWRVGRPVRLRPAKPSTGSHPSRFDSCTLRAGRRSSVGWSVSLITRRSGVRFSPATQTTTRPFGRHASLAEWLSTGLLTRGGRFDPFATYCGCSGVDPYQTHDLVTPFESDTRHVPIAQRESTAPTRRRPWFDSRPEHRPTITR
jgi:hypothetical protein